MFDSNVEKFFPVLVYYGFFLSFVKCQTKDGETFSFFKIVLVTSLHTLRAIFTQRLRALK